MKTRWFIWVPLALVAVFAVLMIIRLGQERDDFVQSHAVGQKLAAFTLPPAVEGRPGIDSKSMADGEAKLLNLFGSYCLPCIAEAPQLEAIKQAGVRIDAIAIRDDRDAIVEFLEQRGDPFARIGFDESGQMQVELGASGVPETYVVGPDGTILYQHIGEIRPDQVGDLVSRVKEAQR